MLRRILKILAYAVGGLLGLVVLLLAIVLIGANTGPGRRLIETETASITGNTVRLQGVAGRFPDRLRVATVELADTQGVWLTIRGLSLDWHPLALLTRDIRVDRLAAASIDVPRLAVPNPHAKPAPAGKSGSLDLPLGLHLAVLDLPDIAIGAALTGGHALGLGVHGHADIASLQPILAGPTLDTLPDTDLDLRLTNRGGPGTYELAGHITPGAIALNLKADEQGRGLIATFAHSTQILPLHLDLALAGPHASEALRLALAAGPLTLAAHGTTDLVHRVADLTLSAQAPAMTPVPGISWQSVALDADLRGPYATPHATGHLDLEHLAAGGATIGALRADLSGDRGAVALHALIDALTIPGPKPGLFAAHPVMLDAHARLDDPTRPVTFTLAHPLLTLAGHATTAQPETLHATLDIPDVAPFAAAGGTDLSGHSRLIIDANARGPDATARLAGSLAITGGLAPAPALIGPGATFSLAAARHGQTLTLDHLQLDGAQIHLAAQGTDAANRLAARFHIALPTLSVLSAAARGHLTIDGTATGPATDLAATVHAAGDVGATQIQTGPITLDVAATGLPGNPAATISAGGRLDGASITLRADAARPPDAPATLHLRELAWKSLHGTADLALAHGAALPTGKLDIAIGRLADLAPLAGQPLAGRLDARFDLANPTSRVDVTATGLAAGSARVARLALTGTVAGPTNPDLDLALALDGLQAGSIAGRAHATARGRLDALALALTADLPNLQNAPAHLATTETLDTKTSEVLLRTLAADWHGESLRLQSPARVTYAPKVQIDRLRLALGGALLSLDGEVSPALGLNASLRNVTPALVKPFAPTLAATGTIDADAHLAGTTARPTGDVRLQAARLHLQSGPAAGLPAANLVATAHLAGDAARLDARLDAGRDIALRVDGTVPIKPAGPLDVAADGTIDLAVANPILEQSGRHLTGRVALAARATGSTAHPTLSGTVTVRGGDLQDYAQGAHLADITADIALAGQTVEITRFDARAGGGTIALAGTVGALAPGLPLDLRLRMHHASPVSSDLLSAQLDADLALTGQAASAMRAAGSLTIVRADINIPNGLPPSVATLHVIKPGQKQPPPPKPNAPATVVNLDLAVHAPGEIFVRGHGLDATLGGDLTVTGTATAPNIEGGFELRRGTFSLAGVNLTFSKGAVGFNGTTNGKLDPTIDFVAQSFVNQYTAQLEVSGYASKPKISLSSTPSLPPDQVLALILFGTETSNLSPLQIAQIAAALASLSGGGGGFDPLAAVRNTLGLDRLSVGSGGNGSNTGASIEGGKYITKRVYVGARQSTAGGGTQALVQIDITKRLKAFTTVGTGGTVTGATTPENDPGSSVGLKYQFRY